MISIAGGRVLTPDGWSELDIAIEGDRIVSVGQGFRADRVIDATGCFVGPGFVDLHVHLREPGQTWKEDVASGTLSAAAGGFTSVFAMPNTAPPVDTASAVRELRDRISSSAVVDVQIAGALTIDRAGKDLVDFEQLYAEGVRMFTDDGDSRSSTSLTAAAMKRLARFPDVVLSQHAELHELTFDGHMHEGEVSRALGVGGLPAAAEYEMIQRDLDLVTKTGVRYHCQHVSSDQTLRLIASAKRDGLPVTAEVTPHHLFFSDQELVGLDTNLKMYPPIRAPRDRDGLRTALRSGLIDAVATDHAPHSEAEKALPFEQAPRGVTGLETAAAVVWTLYEDEDLLFDVLSLNPAAIGGLTSHGRKVEAGGKANLVVFDPEQSGVPSVFKSKSRNSPFLGSKLSGGARATIYEGKVVHEV